MSPRIRATAKLAERWTIQKVELELQTQEMERWLMKDYDTDAHLTLLMVETHKVLSDMRVVITELKEVILTNKRKD